MIPDDDPPIKRPPDVRDESHVTVIADYPKWRNRPARPRSGSRWASFCPDVLVGTLFLWVTFFMSLLGIFLMAKLVAAAAQQQRRLRRDGVALHFAAHGWRGTPGVVWSAGSWTSLIRIAAPGALPQRRERVFLSLPSATWPRCPGSWCSPCSEPGSCRRSADGINAVAAAYYPTTSRATGGPAEGVGRLGSVLGSMLGGVLLSPGRPLSTTFEIFAMPARNAEAGANRDEGVLRVRRSPTGCSAGPCNAHHVQNVQNEPSERLSILRGLISQAPRSLSGWARGHNSPPNPTEWDHPYVPGLDHGSGPNDLRIRRRPETSSRCQFRKRKPSGSNPTRVDTHGPSKDELPFMSRHRRIRRSGFCRGDRKKLRIAWTCRSAPRHVPK